MEMLNAAKEITRLRGCFYLSTILLLRAGQVFTRKSEEYLEERGDGGFNVEYELTNTVLCCLYVSQPHLCQFLMSIHMQRTSKTTV